MADGFREHGAGEDIWALEGRGKKAGDKNTRKALRPALATYYSGDQMKKNEMGGICGTYGRQEVKHTGFWLGDLREKNTFQT